MLEDMISTLVPSRPEAAALFPPLAVRSGLRADRGTSRAGRERPRRKSPPEGHARTCAAGGEGHLGKDVTNAQGNNMGTDPARLEHLIRGRGAIPIRRRPQRFVAVLLADLRVETRRDEGRGRVEVNDEQVDPALEEADDLRHELLRLRPRCLVAPRDQLEHSDALVPFPFAPGPRAGVPAGRRALHPDPGRARGTARAR